MSLVQGGGVVDFGLLGYCVPDEVVEVIVNKCLSGSALGCYNFMFVSKRWYKFITTTCSDIVKEAYNQRFAYYYSGICGCRMVILKEEHMNLNVKQDALKEYDWKCHPMATPDSYKHSITLSLNLLQLAKNLVKVLQWTDSHPHTKDPLYIKKSVLSYQKYLESVFVYQKSGRLGELKRPPLSINMIFVSHLVRTPQYMNYCKERYGEVLFHSLDHVPMNEFDDDFLPDDQDLESMNSHQIDSSLGFTVDDIIKDRKWINWLYETLPIGTDLYDDEYLESAYKCYVKFLYISAQFPNYVFNPTFSCDLMWHTHMCHPLNYISDCNRLCGKVVHHEAWPHVDLGLVQRRKDTVNIWEQEYHEPLLYVEKQQTTQKIQQMYQEIEQM
eukprot:TRINITY_DN22892_c0_g1_i1.p1 TRINITY_DN22892_c0_g1~~TRINITY_DN22892_c0_g1_i1.p1  ORF type:complete len:385 (+),score=102.64 TRINITY_DN22892_c0_g1_i1:44-1198(+)